MTILSKLKQTKIQLDLTGPDGNAYVLLATGANIFKTLKLKRLKGKTWDEIREEMTMSDYENLVNTFDYYFGDYVDLYR